MSKHIRISAVSFLAAMAIAGVASAQVTSSANFSQGERVMVVRTINVRAAANGTVVGTESQGARGELTGGPVLGGGYTWWQIAYDNSLTGWSAEDFIQSASVSLQNPPAAVIANASVQTTINTNVAAAAGAPASSAMIAQLEAQLQSLLSQLNGLK